jgi:transcription elongation factor GreA-like protein
METYDYDDRFNLVTVRSLINKDINDAETKEELLEILEEAKQKRLIQIFKNVKDIKPRLVLKVGSDVKYTKLPSEIGNLTQLIGLEITRNQL